MLSESGGPPAKKGASPRSSSDSKAPNQSPESTSDLSTRPERFLNREMSWLAFNARVLEEALNSKNPLLERLRFLSIAANNQEEFFMVRVASLKAQVKSGVTRRSPEGFTPSEQLEMIAQKTMRFAEDLRSAWSDLRRLLEHENIHLLKTDDLTKTDRRWAQTYFDQEIFPVLTPIAVDSSHPFPFVPNKGVAVAMRLQKPSSRTDLDVLIVLPPTLQRFIRLPGKHHRYMLMEDFIVLHTDRLFPKPTTLRDYATFRVLRDSEIEIEDEADNLVQTFEMALKRRRRGEVMRLTVNDTIEPELLEFLTHHLHVKKEDVLFFGDLIGMADLKELVTTDKPELLFKHFDARFPERVHDFEGDCFAAIRAKDFIVHHPYESFDVVVQFLRQAARDPDVISIKQTIYRTNRKSPIIEALIEAAENGKSVTAVVEIKARFDEEANLRWAMDMEKAGVQVVFGFMQLKTHAKVSLVTRREQGQIVNYAHIGTGNYHTVTARVYTDLSLFTCHPELCRDAALLFNYMTGYAVPENMKHIAAAPFNLRETLMESIEAEASNAKRGKPAGIWIKCNSVADPEMIDALYRASQAGVKIEMIVRGICMLRPGIPGLSENISVKSILGRFLEHARIYCFASGQSLPSPKAKVFISSADLMPRNLSHRIETLVPLLNSTVHRQVVSEVMLANLKDEAQSWIMQPDGHYERIVAGPEAFNVHQYFLDHPSLSGRGSALHSHKE